MTDRQILTAAVRAEPECDRRRYALADAMQEDGEAGAGEFVGLSVEWEHVRLRGDTRGEREARRRTHDRLCHLFRTAVCPPGFTPECPPVSPRSAGYPLFRASDADGLTLEWRRGFVVGVRTPVARWAGDCRACGGGLGAHFVSGRVEDRVAVPGRWEYCPACRGRPEGRGTAEGAAIIRDHPFIERVWLTDRTPSPPGHGGGGRWAWIRVSAGSAWPFTSDHVKGTVSRRLFDCLSLDAGQWDDVTMGLVWYETEADAVREMSAACIMFANQGVRDETAG